MAQFSRLHVLNSIIETGLLPLFYHDNLDVAVKIVEACLSGGVSCIEFTNRGDRAHLVFQELARCFEKDRRLILGAGSILDAGTAALYIQLGANFIVGPVLNPEVARVCNRRKIAYLPGCGSVNEISTAEELGVEIVKIFPGSQVGGPSFVKAVSGPMPWSKLMPTGGVEPTEENIRAWFEAGVVCVGMGSNLVRKDLVAAGKFEEISKITSQTLAWIQAVRKTNPIDL